VLVHGAWHGGWCWKRVAELLRAQGHRVYSPSLTGLADRSHLLSPSIGLQHHVDDICHLVEWEDLDSFVLCGHSYGGMVITGVAEAMAHRIKALVYLDAFLPGANQSTLDLMDPGRATRIRTPVTGETEYYVAPISAAAFKVNEKDQAWVDAKCTSHPLATFEDSLPLVGRYHEVPAKFYVLANAYNGQAFVDAAERHRNRPDWKVFDLPFGHDLMIDAPQEIAEILVEASSWVAGELDAVQPGT
jgi:pimeloyl-ACP methyl ester carboxylesterase